jgi:5-formyltetrahydrofolate cyclo-ligase
MSETIQALKKQRRQEVLSKVAGLSDNDRKESAAAAFRLLEQTQVWAKAKTVLFYAPIGRELDVWPWLLEALAQGKQTALPRFDPKTKAYEACAIHDPNHDIYVGHYGIREPSRESAVIPLIQLDLVLVPGVAFDLHGWRLGRGKGYYDKLLAEVRGATCGVGYEEQLLNTVPTEPHDRQLTCILTPKRWVPAGSVSVLA